MLNRQFNDSDSQESVVEAHHRIPVSVLKHLPAARKILQGENKTYQIYSPRCVYKQQLNSTLKNVHPSVQDNSQRVCNRLISMQDAVFEYAKMKQKMKDLYGKKDKQTTVTLWDVFQDQQPYYSRFEPNQKKHNFANVFVNVANINLQQKLRPISFPGIKNKPNSINQNNKGSVIFDSHFESGNLLYVYQNNDQLNQLQTFDLVLQNDTNSRGHNQWFYFKMTNTKKHQKIKINIVNFVKKESLFSYGLKPLTFSQKNSKNGVNWIRNGQKLYYQQNHIKKQYSNDAYHTLTFEYEFRQAFDTVYFAPSYPYTYTQLLYYMDSLLNNKKYSRFITIKKLCETPGKNTINIITIATGQQSTKQNKIVWILARQHPVQTTSSYMLEGIINHLLEEIHKATQQGSNFYDQYVFKIIPMVNPDGVIHGNTRAELTGIDPNRVWKKPSKNVTPGIYHIKKQILKSKEENCLVLDLHSHSKKLGCFFYGNYETADVKNFRLLPSTVCQEDPRFCYRNCRFRGGHENSARRTLFNQLKIPNIFTVQCSLLGYIKDNRINQYKITDYHQMGSKIISTFFDLQKQKLSRPAITYPNESNDFCDAQSARSDSCVSDEQYQDVYNFGKIKKKIKEHPKKTKLRSNTIIYSHKSQADACPSALGHFNHSKIHQQLKKSDQGQKLREKNRQKVLHTDSKENMSVPRSEHRRQFSVKLSKYRHPPRNYKIATSLLKKQVNVSIPEQPVSESVLKAVGDKAIQVQQKVTSIQNIEEGEKRCQNRLMVYGSAVQDDKIFVGSNEVGIQLTIAKQNTITFQYLKKTHSNKATAKFLRRILQPSDVRALKEKRNMPMFRN